MKLCQSESHARRRQPSAELSSARALGQARGLHAPLIVCTYLFYLQGISHCFLLKVQYLK